MLILSKERYRAEKMGRIKSNFLSFQSGPLGGNCLLFRICFTDLLQIKTNMFNMVVILIGRTSERNKYAGLEPIFSQLNDLTKK